MKIVALRITILCKQFKDNLFEVGLKDPKWMAMREVVTEKKTLIDSNITVENDLLLYKNRWYILNYTNIKKRIVTDMKARTMSFTHRQVIKVTLDILQTMSLAHE